MICEVCSQAIAPERLQAVPGVKMCTKCTMAKGDVPRVKGRNVYEHKTAGAVQVLSPEAFERANNADPRGFGKEGVTNGKVDGGRERDRRNRNYQGYSNDL